VADASGAPVPGLHSDDFLVFEDDVPQKLTYFQREVDLPFTAGLIVDLSSSENLFIDQHRQTLLQFFAGVLSQGDRAFLVSAADQQRLVTDLTNSVETLRAGAESLGKQDAPVLGVPCSFSPRGNVLSECSGTALWNAVFFSARLKLQPQAGRKAILLLTDGMDTGSEHGLAEAIQACQGADAIVYSIRYADTRFNFPMWAKVAFPFTMLQDQFSRALAKGKRELQQIAQETGGLTFEGKSDKLPQIFERIEADLRSEYVLGYTLSAARPAHGYHKLMVKVTRAGLKVRAREGYYY
jgi:VWFA-related protein